MKTILFADDDALVARIYRDKLSAEGFHVTVAEDGVAAIKQLVELKPDVLVLDLLMPKLNGADVLKFIREHPQLKSTPVIVFSNSFLAALVERVGDLGVEGVLPKSSATPSRLIELIRQVLAPNAPSTPLISAAKVPQPNKIPSAAPALFKNTPGSGRTTENQDEHFRKSVHTEFVKHLPRVLADIRQLSQTLVEASDLKSEMRVVEDLARKVGFLTQMASMAECPELAQLASALELLFFHLHETKSLVEDSCRNTIAVTVAFLTKHLEHFDPLLAKESLSASILIVNDDLASNRALVHALTHANLSATSLTDPTEALEQLRYTAYNLIIVDVELPLMNGLALCEQIRGLDLHRLTPVIFITSRNDLKTRARYTLSGGDDFISKPVLPIELTVKVITHLLKSRVGK